MTIDQSVPGAQPAAPTPGLIQPVEHETADRIITALVSLIPFLLLAVAAWQVWNEALHWRDLAILAALYSVTALGVTVGFHRLLTHRSFKTSAALRGVMAAIGSAAIEGPVISWVADHRKHHAFADEPGDPHSPHVGHGVGWRGALRGLFHAHMGWLFIHTERGSKQRFAPDLMKDRVVSMVNRTFVLWALLGLVLEPRDADVVEPGEAEHGRRHRALRVRAPLLRLHADAVEAARGRTPSRASGRPSARRRRSPSCGRRAAGRAGRRGRSPGRRSAPPRARRRAASSPGAGRRTPSSPARRSRAGSRLGRR